MGFVINKRKTIGIVGMVVLIFMLVFSTTSIALGYDEDSMAEWLESQCKLNRNGEVVYSNTLQDILRSNPYTGDDSDTHAISINIEGEEHVIFMSQAAYEQVGNRVDKALNKQRVQQKIDNMGVNFDVEADVEAAGVALSGLREVVAMIVGLIAYLIVLGMTLFTTLDICYITMPVFRNKADEMVQRGGVMSRVDNRTGETTHRWITDDARYAVANATIESGKSPLAIYLGKRIWAYILLAIVLFILLTGNIQLIVNIAINFISGLIEVLEGLA